ncbi:hypothetical protein HZH66_013736 [Vespula vulgaris]|uniref:CST complex subunit Stn1 N-terminal domain-containing protein n=1 Tax=Vespula vulgaris TaxID=7454 RepID=A0A834J680_VESVU|nr:uncharacterized protein LOC127071231 [Vespula vulgaris]KAF7381342.1 hypothetical protein HZH66_013736 [Vespula vulgaris]
MEYKTMTSRSKGEILKKKEWPGIRTYENSVTRIEPNLLIIEIGRLIPFMKGENVKFFPLNMPSIEIGFIHIIGIILEVSYFGNYCELQVDDGTGLLNVMYNTKRHFLGKRKYNEIQNSNNDKKSTSIQKIEDLQPGKHVYLQGFLSLNNYKNTNYVNFKNKGPSENFWCSQPLLFAVKLQLISEKEYYKKMYAWFGSAESRYT